MCRTRHTARLHSFRPPFSLFFFFTDTATTEIYTLSLHDALPISSSSILRDWINSAAIRSTRHEWTHPRVESCALDRKSTRLNSSHVEISYAVFCLKKKKIPPTVQGAPDNTTDKKKQNNVVEHVDA